MADGRSVYAVENKNPLFNNLYVQLAIIHSFTALWDIKFEKIVNNLKIIGRNQSFEYSEDKEKWYEPFLPKSKHLLQLQELLNHRLWFITVL